MKIRIERISEGEAEVVLKYREKTREVEELLAYLNKRNRALLCRKDAEDVLLKPGDVIYLESVDGTTYAYTENDVLQAGLSLAGAEAEYADDGFFRCSKSMVININKVVSLKSLSSNRIDATMEGGEHIIISRRYASEFRRILKGER